MEEAGQQGQDRGSSASISTPPLHGGDGSSADNRIDKPRSPKNERMVSNQSEAWNPSRVQTPVNSSNIYTPPEQTYFYGGYDDGLVNWGENSNYLHTNNLQFMPQAIYNDNSSLIYHPAYTFDTQIAYNQFPPLSPIMIDGQLYSPHQLPISPSFYSQPISPTDLSPPQDGLIDNMFLTPQSGYYLHYPTSNNLGFYKYPGEPVSNQPTPVGILGPYEHSFGQQTPYHVGTRMTHQEGVDRDSVESHATTSDRNRGPRASKLKGPGLVTSNDRYNREDFVTSYEKAKFFVIKSFSEDNVHRSIKYGVWASTPLGNRKLDSAFKEAKEDGDTCRIFLFFSVNASGQFCGVAEMIGAVDFENDADYWQQDRWSGQFRVQWHILKDVPNSRFRHILVENNDHKPVTHSRDSQEVKLEEGIAMLKIFKEHDADTSILDDFHFYDEREKSFQEKRSKEQVSSTKTTVDDASINRLSERVADSLHLEKAQGGDY